MGCIGPRRESSIRRYRIQRGMHMDFEIVKYLRLIKRWWWLLVVSAVIPMAVSYHLVSNQPDVYQAKVTLMVGTSLQSANPDPRLMNISSALAAAYRQLVTYDPITEAVIERLGLERSPGQLASQITTWVYPEAQLLEIRVVDANPRAAALIANALAEELIARTPESDEVRQFEADFARKQLGDLRARIKKVQADIQELSASMVNLTSAAEIQDEQARLSGLQQIESMYQSAYAQLLASYTGGASPNILRVFDPAVEPHRPIARKTVPVVAIAGAAGFGLALTAVLLIEYLDDSVRWEGEMKQTLLGMPVLGAIAKVRDRKGSVVKATNPESPSAEMVRMLRTNIFLAAGDRRLETLLVTSPTERAGKTFAVAQLGLAIAAAGRRVIMVDADMRRPALHEPFDLPNPFGLSELLAGDEPLGGSDWPRGVQETGVENLYLLPGGKPPLDPGWVLTSPRLVTLLDALKQQADVIIVDSTPGLAAPDALVLASVADGTLLVVGAGITSRSKTLKTEERLMERDGVNLLGVAYNRVKVDSEDYCSCSSGVGRQRPVRGFWALLRARLPLVSAKGGQDQAILNLVEMAGYLGVSRATARRWCKNGRLPAFKSRLQWCITEEDLQTAVGRTVCSQET
jgi:succinoglycan biosynthesis transport protein ExoP